MERRGRGKVQSTEQKNGTSREGTGFEQSEQKMGRRGRGKGFESLALAKQLSSQGRAIIENVKERTFWLLSNSMVLFRLLSIFTCLFQFSSVVRTHRISRGSCLLIRLIANSVQSPDMGLATPPAPVPEELPPPPRKRKRLAIDRKTEHDREFLRRNLQTSHELLRAPVGSALF